MPKNSSARSNTLLILVSGILIGGLVTVALMFTPLANQLQPEKEVTFAVPVERIYEAASLVELPDARLTSQTSVEEAIQSRRSQREFTDQAVTLPELSQMLWAAQGITDSETGHRAVPSSRGTYPLTVFVVVRNVTGIEPGLYEYLPENHALGSLDVPNAGELLSSAGVQPGAQNSPVAFLVTAAYGSVQEVLGDSTIESSLLEAGHLGQNMYLVTESLDMGMVVMGGFDPAVVGEALSLDPAEEIIYLIPFGHVSDEATEVLGETIEELPHFTEEELAQHDGKEGRKAYFAYKGSVYDVTGSPEWELGKHYGLEAGKDLTGMMGEAPHGDEVLTGFDVVGTYGDGPVDPTDTATVKTDYSILLYGAGALLVIGIVFAGVRAALRGAKPAKKSKKK